MQHPPARNHPHQTGSQVACDGSGEVDAALGHPRVYLHIDDTGFVDCGYCDRRFVLEGGRPTAESSTGA